MIAISLINFIDDHGISYADRAKVLLLRRFHRQPALKAATFYGQKFNIRSRQHQRTTLQRVYRTVGQRQEGLNNPPFGASVDGCANKMEPFTLKNPRVGRAQPSRLWQIGRSKERSINEHFHAQSSHSLRHKAPT